MAGITLLAASPTARAEPKPRPGASSRAADKAARKAAKKARKKARKRAKRYAKKATKAYAKRRWDDAIVAFELAHQADPQPRYLFNIGRCLEQKGDLFKAMEYVRAYVDEVEDEAEREDAQETYNILRGKLLKSRGELSLRSEPSGATVTLESEDGTRRKGATPYLDWLEAGTWSVRVALDGHETAEDRVVVGVGKSVERSFELRPPAPEPEPEPEPPAAEEPDPVSGPDGRAVAGEEAPPEPEAGGGLAGWATLGAGAALLAGGAVAGVLAWQANGELERFRDEPGTASRGEAEAARETSETGSLAANVLLGAGAVAVGAGVVLLLVGEEGEAEEAAAGLLPVPGGAVLTVGGCL